ncbi:M17 family metallopeptidase [Haliangium ochraceum]|uniref:Leucyl aminopeptidase n=1 Tax=Haliangium ochraceum (strain DSM 14365 / JCM 11303 / SMP-2) TaxID=502025 RepID=D0LI38_HALO1|nr:leucyl aminopeptidase family protein [Haliangium ochraceum]ACY14867.1 Leucyl aminopeptidase [Haliangium ochraceum DSM 14365]
MTDLSFSPDPQTALAGARSLLLLAPKKRFDRRTLGRIVSAEQARILADIASEVQPGDLGRTTSTVSQSRSGPRRILAGVLPDTVSRYNTPSRAESVRRAAKSIEERGVTAVIAVLEDPAHALAVANAIARSLSLYSARSKPKAKTGSKTSKRSKVSEAAPEVRIAMVDVKGAPIEIDDAVRETAHMTREAAQLVDTPPSDLGPDGLSERARALIAEVPRTKVREIVGKDLLKQGLGGIEAVGRAALEPPRLLIAQYKPSKRSSRHLALIGKGISFDTGGLCLKPRGVINGMKADMGGAAAVLGAFCALAKTGYPHKLSLLLCIAENAIGPGAFKPDDVLHMHSGRTVEINNTDAEGRLVLADGLSYAARELGADTVIDAATLTGAQMVATGQLHAAVVSSDEALEQTLIAAGRSSGDLVHALPFAPEFYKQEFKSTIADMRNSVKNRANAQTSCAAQFLHWHIEDCDVSWGHVDLAGPAVLQDRATGFGVALLCEALRQLA